MGALSIGIFVLPVAIAGTLYLRRHRSARPFATGVISGIGLPLLYVAFLNRGGPGTVCAGTQCDQQLSPWPWLVAGVLFLLLGVAADLLRTVRRQAPAQLSRRSR